MENNNTKKAQTIEDLDFEFTNMRVERYGGVRSPYRDLIEAFLGCKERTCILNVASSKNVQSTLQAIRYQIDKYNYPVVCGKCGKQQIYIVRHGWEGEKDE